MYSVNLMHLEVTKYHFNCPHSCDWRQRIRPYATMALMIEGTGEFVSSNETFIIKSGDMVFIPNGINYISHWDGIPNSYISIHFLFESEFPQCDARNFKLQKLSGLDFDSTYRALENIRLDLEEGNTKRISAVGGFFKFYSDIMMNLEPAEDYRAAVKSIQPALDYLKTEKGNVQVGQLAELCHLSESRFYTLFKMATGVSPIKYKNNILIRQAINMLQSGMPIQAISDELGFSSPSYFRRIFKQTTGKNPKEYIKSKLI